MKGLQFKEKLGAKLGCLFVWIILIGFIIWFLIEGKIDEEAGKNLYFLFLGGAGDI